MKKLILIALIGISVAAYGQHSSITGTTGLFRTPTAEFSDDGLVSVGANWMSRKHLAYFKHANDIGILYTSLNFMPFWEINLRITRALKPEAENYTWDRTPMVRLRVLKERRYLPAIALGAHDFLWVFGGVDAIHFNATYVVGSKHFKLTGAKSTLGAHMGYAIKIRKAAHYDFAGMFGGLSWQFFDRISIMAEHDSRHINLGANIKLFKYLNILAGLENLDAFAGGVRFSHQL